MSSVGRNVGTLLGHTTSQNKARRRQVWPRSRESGGDIGAVGLAVLQLSSFLGTRAPTLPRRLFDRGVGLSRAVEYTVLQYYLELARRYQAELSVRTRSDAVVLDGNDIVGSGLHGSFVDNVLSHNGRPFLDVPSDRRPLSRSHAGQGGWRRRISPMKDARLGRRVPAEPSCQTGNLRDVHGIISRAIADGDGTAGSGSYSGPSLIVIKNGRMGE